MFSNFGGIYPEDGFMGHVVTPLNFLRNFHNVFHSGCTSLPPAVNEGSFFSITSPTLVINFLIDTSHSNRCVVVVLICITLIASEIEHFLTYLLAICMFS